jgi:DNA-binding response OmpR family regulator
MADPLVVIVDGDARGAALVARALESLGIRRPVTLDSGEAAVLWIGANACDLCVLDFQLPGIDGLETLARLRQRRPELQIIMVSAAESERVAIAAFHAGVLDYVPKLPGYADVVANLVRQATTAAPEEVAAAPPPLSPDILPELMRPTYQNRLRTIGRQLDIYNYQSANLLEVAGGFVVRATKPGSRAPDALEFPERDFPVLMAHAIQARKEGDRRRTPLSLIPTGYEDFLRAIGRRLDEHNAEAVTITDLGTLVAVGGVMPADAYSNVKMAPLQWLLREDDITFLLDESYRLRAATATKRGLFGRVIGRADDERR